MGCSAQPLYCLYWVVLNCLVSVLVHIYFIVYEYIVLCLIVRYLYWIIFIWLCAVLSQAIPFVPIWHLLSRNATAISPNTILPYYHTAILPYCFASSHSGNPWECWKNFGQRFALFRVLSMANLWALGSQTWLAITTAVMVTCNWMLDIPTRYWQPTLDRVAVNEFDHIAILPYCFASSRSGNP